MSVGSKVEISLSLIANDAHFHDHYPTDGVILSLVESVVPKIEFVQDIDPTMYFL